MRATHLLAFAPLAAGVLLHGTGCDFYPGERSRTTDTGAGTLYSGLLAVVDADCDPEVWA